MPVYEASIQVASQATAPYVVCALRGPTGLNARLLELDVFTLTAPTTSLQLVLCNSTALGTGALSNNMIGISRTSDRSAGTGNLIGTWATARPTIGGVTTYMKRIVLPASLGAGVMRSFDLAHPLELALGNAAAGDLCLVQTSATASGDLAISAAWIE